MIISDELNRDLLILLRDFLNDNQDRHEQTTWITGVVRPAQEHPDATGAELARLVTESTTCGTAGCVAGWAALFGGYRQLTADDQRRCYTASDDVYDPAVPGYFLSMQRAARAVLGLSVAQAHMLFWGDNTLDEINEMIDALLADPSDDLSAFRNSQRYGHEHEHDWRLAVGDAEASYYDCAVPGCQEELTVPKVQS